MVNIFSHAKTLAIKKMTLGLFDKYYKMDTWAADAGPPMRATKYQTPAFAIIVFRRAFVHGARTARTLQG